MFSLICVWINGWVNNRQAGDLRRYRAHYDVMVVLLADVVDSIPELSSIHNMGRFHFCAKKNVNDTVKAQILEL